MLNGVTGQSLVDQWRALSSLAPALSAFAPRPVLLVAAEHDDIFPPSQYARTIAGFEHVELISRQDTDHSFSACRRWLVKVVTDWLLSRLNAG